jgi:hypothetical protein
MSECKKCGKEHGMGIEDMKTGEITPIDLCEDCLFEGCGFKYDPEYQAKLENDIEKIKKLLNA